MGAALAQAALDEGHEVLLVSGPVLVDYPAEAVVTKVETTQQMLDACLAEYPHCDGVICAAAPCDYQPVEVRQEKMAKTGETLSLELTETPDIAAALGNTKQGKQWLVAFALETSHHNERAAVKLKKKNGDMIIVNGPAAMDAANTSVEVLAANGQSYGCYDGPKSSVAKDLLRIIGIKLMS